MSSELSRCFTRGVIGRFLFELDIYLEEEVTECSRSVSFFGSFLESIRVKGLEFYYIIDSFF